MKKVGFMIVYNDVDYIDYSIRSVKDWLDELIIVEGAFKITMQAGKPPRSNDGTLDIINSHVDNKRIFLKQANLQEHKDHYDIGFQEAMRHGADWCIMVDSDEIWDKKNQLFMDKQLMNMEPFVKELRIHEYSFKNDFKTWYNGTYPRFFRSEEGARFVFDNEVQYQEGRCRHIVRTIPENLVKIFHYGYVRKKDRWRMKQDCMWNKDQNPINLQYKLEGNDYVIPSDIPIYSFTGKHPEIMRTHKWHDKTAEEIIYG